MTDLWTCSTCQVTLKKNSKYQHVLTKKHLGDDQYDQYVRRKKELEEEKKKRQEAERIRIQNQTCSICLEYRKKKAFVHCVQCVHKVCKQCIACFQNNQCPYCRSFVPQYIHLRQPQRIKRMFCSYYLNESDMWDDLLDPND